MEDQENQCMGEGCENHKEERHCSAEADSLIKEMKNALAEKDRMINQLVVEVNKLRTNFRQHALIAAVAQLINKEGAGYEAQWYADKALDIVDCLAERDIQRQMDRQQEAIAKAAEMQALAEKMASDQPMQ